MHVADLAFACLFALENWDPNKSNAPLDEKGSPLSLLNVGWGQDISIKELARLISIITSFKGEIIWDKEKPDGTYQKLLDISKLKSLGWKPKIQLDEGLKMTYKNYKEDFLNNSLRYK